MCQLANILIGIIRSNYISIYEIICSYEAKNVKKTYLSYIAVFNASCFCFEGK